MRSDGAHGEWRSMRERIPAGLQVEFLEWCGYTIGWRLSDPRWWRIRLAVAQLRERVRK